MQQPSEITELHCLLQSNLSQFPFDSGLITSNTNTTTPTNQTHTFSINPLYQLYTTQVQEFSPKSTCLSSNSTTSDEADEQNMMIINERKQRRMISNRESARRSRMRKQRHLDELWSQVVCLRHENHQLIDKLNNASESQDRLLHENAQLKEEASELRQMLNHMQLNSPCPSLTELDEDEPCNHLP
ncbi:basic leucine-zipper 42 [Perilla frutescens var. frutescens]|nr:basic leucine-zipper 42 [Perilla frutescens var. frutescens]